MSPCKGRDEPRLPGKMQAQLAKPRSCHPFLSQRENFKLIWPSRNYAGGGVSLRSRFKLIWLPYLFLTKKLVLVNPLWWREQRRASLARTLTAATSSRSKPAAGGSISAHRDVSECFGLFTMAIKEVLL